MKQLTFTQKVEKCFLTAQERAKVEKLAIKEPCLHKSLMINDSFQDALIQKSLNILLGRIEGIERSLNDVEAFLSDGEPLKITVGKDYEGNPIKDEYDKPIGIMIDKTNGISERMRDMIKELKSSTEDAMDIILSKRNLLGVESVTKEELSLGGMSWSDRLAEERKKK
jgi:hypothetical protein